MRLSSLQQIVFKFTKKSFVELGPDFFRVKRSSLSCADIPWLFAIKDSLDEGKKEQFSEVKSMIQFCKLGYSKPFPIHACSVVVSITRDN